MDKISVSASYLNCRSSLALLSCERKALFKRLLIPNPSAPYITVAPCLME